MNQLLLSLTTDQREVLATMLAQEFVSGVHEALVVLYEEQVTPLDDGYEGDPYHDFVGRLDGWTWPAQSAERAEGRHLGHLANGEAMHVQSAPSPQLTENRSQPMRTSRRHHRRSAPLSTLWPATPSPATSDF